MVVKVLKDEKKKFILADKYDFIINYDVQKNLKNLYKIYGEEFIIEFNINNKKIIIPVSLKYTSEKFSDIKFYRLFYNLEDRTSTQLPFKIDFIDKYTKKLNDICYIVNIHKTDTISGSEMIQLVNEINKKIGIKKAYIHDATTVYCGLIEYDLSFMKLLENDMTFYMKYGFDIENKMKKDLLLKLIKLCKNVKNDDIKNIYYKLFELIMNIINDEKEKNNIKIYHKYSNSDDDYDKWLVNISIDELLQDVNNILNLYANINEEYLYESMIKLFNERENCLDYNIIYKNFIDTNLYKIVYKDIELNFTIFDNFRILKSHKTTSYSNTYR
jgi:hypothetical protein